MSVGIVSLQLRFWRGHGRLWTLLRRTLYARWRHRCTTCPRSSANEVRQIAWTGTVRRSPLSNRFRTLQAQPPAHSTWGVRTRLWTKSAISPSQSIGFGAAWICVRKKTEWAWPRAWVSWGWSHIGGSFTRERRAGRPRSTLFISQRPRTITCRHSNCFLQMQFENWRLFTTHLGLSVEPQGRLTMLSAITGYRSDTLRRCKIALMPAGHAAIQPAP